MHGVRAFLHQFDSGAVQTDSRAAGEHVLPSAHLAWHTSSGRKARALLAPNRGHANPHGLPSWLEAEPGLPQQASRVEKAAAWFRRHPMNTAIWSGCNRHSSNSNKAIYWSGEAQLFSPSRHPHRAASTETETEGWGEEAKWENEINHLENSWMVKMVSP